MCTGNICRSPLTAQLVAAACSLVALGDIIAVESAGLGALVGEPMDAVPAAISARHGGNPAGHHARQLSETAVNRSDLVLTMTRAQRDDLIGLHPRALHRTFSLTELTKLMSIDESNETVAEQGRRAVPYPPDALSRLQLRTREMSRVRSRAEVAPDDDIVDPYRGSEALHEAVGEQISEACLHLVTNFVRWATAAPVAASGW